ncbi:unnamed protein product [Adineta ricciae]|uniref:Uncharacterized protein n=1 Tax=Adineta ricciae TaxID=249248 RepID=A0A815F7E3_ADIRI|nr:unnamed protein product [Adineta ricciae]CAF1321373.1 unnamed protein product [Adineta ricciae]
MNRSMELVETQNDEEIARVLQDEYNFQIHCVKRSRSPSPTSKKFKQNDAQDIPATEINAQDRSSSEVNQICAQTDDDAEMALVLQIEEIVLAENQINEKTIQATDDQLQQTHTAMTKALQPVEETNTLKRAIGMFTTIKTRYDNCQTKNQALIDQIQKLSVQLYPLLISFKTGGNSHISKAAVPVMAVGLITNVLRGNMSIDDAKQIIYNMVQLWTDSSVWYEFIEQLVYILVAITIPAFGQKAMGNLMTNVSS